MANAAIRFPASALASLEGSRDGYAEQGVPHFAERRLRKIMAAIEDLADHPDMGRIVPELDQPALWELIRPPFRIVKIWRSERLLVLTEDGDG